MYSKDEVKELKAEFWQAFKKASKKHRGNSQKWVMQNTGIKGLQLKIELERNRAAVLLHLHGSRENRELLFEILEQYRKMLSGIWIDEEPIWEKRCKLEGYSDSAAIYFQKKEDFDLYDQKQWATILQFLIEKMDQLEKAFLEVKEVVKTEFKELS